jgi:hypothetical protein
VVDGEKLATGPSKITVKLGSSVRINIEAKEEEVRVKLEGYDIITEHDPSDETPGGFSFIADKAGSFNYYTLAEAEPDGTPHPEQHYLGTIEVRP